MQGNHPIRDRPPATREAFSLATHRIHKSGHFAQIPNALLRDDRLSFRARGVIAYMLTHADGWHASIKDIAADGREGQGAVATAMKELEALGYRKVVRRQGDSGRWATEIHWFESPSDGEPELGNRVSVHSGVIEDQQNTMKKNARSSSSTSLRSADSSSLAFEHPVCRHCCERHAPTDCPQ